MPTATPLQISISAPASVPQGDTLAVRIETNKPAEVDGTLGGIPLTFWSNDDLTHTALVGVSAIADLEDLALYVTATDLDNQVVSLNSNVDIVGGSFENEYLVFDEETSALLDSSYTAPEAALLSQIYGSFTSDRYWDGTFSWPVSEDTPITSYFGTRRWYGDAFYSYHAGTDLGAEAGTPVLACADGVVALAETLYVRGNAVIIDHGQGVFTGYYHMSELDVKVGQTVHTGDQLGLVGTTGLSTGAHLHWELEIGGIPVNVLEWTQTAY